MLSFVESYYLQEYEEHYDMKFGRKPKLVRKLVSATNYYTARWGHMLENRVCVELCILIKNPHIRKITQPDVLPAIEIVKELYSKPAGPYQDSHQKPPLTVTVTFTSMYKSVIHVAVEFLTNTYTSHRHLHIASRAWCMWHRA